MLVVFLISIASVSASDANDTAIASEDTATIEISQNEEISLNDNNQAIGQANDKEIISQGNTGTFTELQNNITATSSGSTLELDRNYEYNDGFDTNVIRIDKTITIDGKGYTIDAKGQARVFDVMASDVTIKNLTIINVRTDSNGGAVYFYSSGTVSNCNFVNNTAKYLGGAVYFSSSGSAHVVESCNFVNNNAPGGTGGAIGFEGSGTVSNCNFTGNTAGHGCAVYFSSSGSAHVVESCNFVNNTAKYNGGAIDFEGFGTVSNCNFINNTAEFYGGAVYFKSTGTVTNCTFTNNKVNGYNHYGGAVYIGDNGEVRNCTFADNSASGSGGAVYFKSTGNVTNCNFTNNKATDDGGAVYFKSTGTVTNCTFTDNKATGYYGEAGAVCFESNGTVSNCNFTGNTAGYGGAIRFIGEGTVSNCNFTGNTASFNGGAVGMASGIVSNCNFTGNTAGADGGAVWMEYGTVSNCNFTSNTARYGGAVWMNEGIVSNCNFTGNTAYEEGGAVCFESNGEVTNCNFTGNTAGYGGAINIYCGSVSDCNFTGNTAGHGGAIRFTGEGTVSDCNFTGNTADYGGAVWRNSGSVENCNFTGNNATTGSAIYFRSASTLSNSILLNNRADAEAFDVVKNDNSITITFTGRNNLLNAIYSGGDVTFTNVTYWGKNGIATVSATMSRSNKAAGQNITVGVVVNDKLVLSEVMVTDENGMIVLDISAGDNYYIIVRHDTDSYYTEAERIISNNTQLKVNVTSQTTSNKTVNLTAESNIPNDVVKGKLLFILPDGTEINATYDAKGIWWAEYAFDDLGVYQVNASYVGLDNVTLSNGTIAVTAPEHTFWFLNYTINGNDNPVIELSNDFYFDPVYDAAFVNGVVINRPVTINSNGIVIDAKGQARIFDVQSADTVIENLTLKNANYNSGDGGAIYFASSGNVSNCTFTNNTAYEGGAVYFKGAGIVTNCTFTGNTARWYGGALRFRYTSTVTNCIFIGNNATGSGGAISSLSGTLTKCNFTGNTATGSGGAIMFVSSTTVLNCNFNDNSASSGGAVWMSFGSVSNSTFIGNNATTGSAIYFASASALSNSILLNNRADAEALDIVKNDDNITITFTGRNNLLNAIYSEGDVTFTNVTYWGASGITTDSATLSGTKKEAGQNITVSVVVNDVIVLDKVYVTDENGTIVLNINAGENYYITVRHNADSYYTEAEKTISNNTKFNVNVNSQTTNNKTVNITAKSNIYSEVMPGKLLFILPDGTRINATHDSNGTWWAVHTFDSYDVHQVNASYIGLDNVTINNATITITKADSEITFDKLVFDYGDSINVATVGAVGITAKIDGNDVAVIDFTIPLSDLNVGDYTLTVTTKPDEDHNPVTKEVTITVNKVDSTLTVGDIVFDYGSSGFTVVSFTGADGVNASVVSQSDAVVKVDGTTIIISGLDAGTYTLTVTAIADVNHNNVTKNAMIIVNKVNVSLTVDDVVLTYGETKNVTVTTEGATGITAKIDGSDVAVVNNYTVVISGLNVGNHILTVTAIADANHNNITKNVTITVNKLKTELTASAITTTYNINKDLVITLKDSKGNVLSGVSIVVDLNGAKTYTTDKNGQIKISAKGLAPKLYTAKVIFNGNTNFEKSTKDVKVTVKKATPKLTAKKKIFKRTVKTKKYTIVLKDNTGKAMKKVQLTIKVGKKTFKAKTNNKGKATFKIKKLTKKGKYKATVTYKGNKNYNKVTKKVKITIK